MNNYNFLIVGNEQSGKSTFLNKMQTGMYTTSNKSTIEKKICQLYIKTHHEKVTIDLLELNEELNMDKVPDSFYPIDGVIILFYKNTNKTIKVCG